MPRQSDDTNLRSSELYDEIEHLLEMSGRRAVWDMQQEWLLLGRKGRIIRCKDGERFADGVFGQTCEFKEFVQRYARHSDFVRSKSQALADYLRYFVRKTQRKNLIKEKLQKERMEDPTAWWGWHPNHGWIVYDPSSARRPRTKVYIALRCDDWASIEITEDEFSETCFHCREYIESMATDEELDDSVASLCQAHDTFYLRRESLRPLIQEKLPEYRMNRGGAWWGWHPSHKWIVISREDKRNQRDIRLRYALRCSDWMTVEILRTHVEERCWHYREYLCDWIEVSAVDEALAFLDSACDKFARICQKAKFDFLARLSEDTRPIERIGPQNTRQFQSFGPRGCKRRPAIPDPEFPDYWMTHCWKCKKPDLDSYRNEHCEACTGLICDQCGKCHMQCARNG